MLFGFLHYFLKIVLTIDKIYHINERICATMKYLDSHKNKNNKLICWNDKKKVVPVWQQNISTYAIDNLLHDDFYKK
jgi:hypothetical protein